MTAVATLAVRNPYTGELVGDVPLHSPAQVTAALDAAAAAGRARPGGGSRHERGELLFAVAQRLLDRREQLAQLITAESGLSLKDTRHEVGRAADVFRFAAMEALRDDGETFAGDATALGHDRRAHTLREPVGLVAAITPFNHPLNQVAHKVAPALAAGAPIVLKPSERTPLAALALQEILLECGADPDRVQILCGEPAPTLTAFLGHPETEVISFTGGVAVGHEIARRLGYRRAVLELGGNDPLVVLADADLDEAASLAVSGAFANSGQRCTAVKRIIAVEAVAEALAERVAAGAAALRCADPADPRTEVGTVIDEPSAGRIAHRVHDAVAGGARLLGGGERAGAQLTPAVLDHVDPACELVATETFGPVAPIIRVADLDDAIATANATSYALSAGVCTSDWPSIARCVRELHAGTVNIREVPGWRTELTPFGGFGDSGLGVKEGVRDAIRAMTRVKLYTLPWS